MKIKIYNLGYWWYKRINILGNSQCRIILLFWVQNLKQTFLVIKTYKHYNSNEQLNQGSRDKYCMEYFGIPALRLQISISSHLPLITHMFLSNELTITFPEFWNGQQTIKRHFFRLLLETNSFNKLLALIQGQKFKGLQLSKLADSH